MRMSKIYTGVLIGVLCICVFASGVPKVMNYQGKLTNSSGIAVNGTPSIRFRLYNALSGGSLLWEETQTVSVVNGLFDVQLGITTPLNLAFDDTYWVELTVAGETLSPREMLATNPYSYRAIYADTAFYLGTLTSGDFIQNQTAADQAASWRIAGTGRAVTNTDGYFAIFGMTNNTSGSLARSGVKGAYGNTDSSTGYLGYKAVGASGYRYGVYADDRGRVTGFLASGSEQAGVGGTYLYTTDGGYGGIFRNTSASGTTQYGARAIASGSSAPANKYGLLGEVTGGGSYAYGVAGTASGSTRNYGIYGTATTSTGATTNYGIYGEASAATSNYGVYGTTSSSGGTGVYGINTNGNNSGSQYGVYGTANGTTGGGSSIHYGVYGVAQSGGTNYGGFFSPMLGIEPQSSAPTGAAGGLYVKDAAVDTLYFYTGSSWFAVAPSNVLPSGTSGQTLRHNGTSWVANSTLFNNGTNVGIGTTAPLSLLSVGYAGDANAAVAVSGSRSGGIFTTSSTTDGDVAIRATVTGTSGNTRAIHAINSSTTNFSSAIAANASATTGITYGVYAVTASNDPNSCGVFGHATATGSTGATYGAVGFTSSSATGSTGAAGRATSLTGVVYGVAGYTQSNTNNSTGVLGVAESTSGVIYGVQGSTFSITADAAGVRGIANGTTGVTYGVVGTNASSSAGAAGVRGIMTSSTGQTYAIIGDNASTTAGAAAVCGVSNSAGTYGICGSSTAGYAGYFMGTVGITGGLYDGVSTGTAGQVLTADGAGNFAWQSGGGGISGSGANGHVSYWNGASSQTYSSDGNFYWDETNNRLGIGTTAPAYRLDVAGDFRAYGDGFSANVRSYGFSAAGIGGVLSAGLARGSFASPSNVRSGDFLGFLTFDGYGTSFNDGAAIIGYAAEDWTGSANGAYLTLNTVPRGSALTAERLRVSDSGYVGIGTTAPAHGLDVQWTTLDSAAIRGYYRRTGTTHAAGYLGRSNLLTTSGYPITIDEVAVMGVIPSGAFSTAIGVMAWNNKALSGSTAEAQYATYSIADGTNSGSNKTRYGIYASASGANTNIGGYFNPMIVLPPQSSTPTGIAGALYVKDASPDTVYFYNGSAWTALGGGGGTSLWTDAGSYIYPSTCAESYFVYDDMGSSNNQLQYISAANATDGKQLVRVYNTSTSSVASGRNNAIFAETGTYTGSGGSWALGRSSGAILGYDNSTTGTYSYGVAGYHYGNTANTPHAAVFGGTNFTSTTSVPATWGALGYQLSSTSAQGVYGSSTWSGNTGYGIYGTSSGATYNYGVFGTVATSGSYDVGGYFTNTGTGSIVRAVRASVTSGNSTSGARHYGGYFDGSGASATDARNIGVLGTNSIATSNATTIGVYGDGNSGDTTVGVWGYAHDPSGVAWGVYGEGATYGGFFRGYDRGAMRLYPVASAPATSDAGAMYYNSSTNKMYYYNGSAWIDMTGGGAGSVQVGSMTVNPYFADATADDDWLGLGAAQGRIIFDYDASNDDTISLMSANVGIGTENPTGKLDIRSTTAQTGVNIIQSHSSSSIAGRALRIDQNNTGSGYWSIYGIDMYTDANYGICVVDTMGQNVAGRNWGWATGTRTHAICGVVYDGYSYHAGVAGYRGDGAYGPSAGVIGSSTRLDHVSGTFSDGALGYQDALLREFGVWGFTNRADSANHGVYGEASGSGTTNYAFRGTATNGLYNYGLHLTTLGAGSTNCGIYDSVTVASTSYGMRTIVNNVGTGYGVYAKSAPPASPTSSGNRWGGYFEATGASVNVSDGNNYGIEARATGSANSSYAVHNYAVKCSTYNSAAGGGTTNNSYGVKANVYANGVWNTMNTYGIRADVAGNASSGTTNNYGAYFGLTGGTAGTSKHYGIYTNVAGADTNYGAYFVTTSAASDFSLRLTGDFYNQQTNSSATTSAISGTYTVKTSSTVVYRTGSSIVVNAMWSGTTTSSNDIRAKITRQDGAGTETDVIWAAQGPYSSSRFVNLSLVWRDTGLTDGNTITYRLYIDSNGGTLSNENYIIVPMLIKD